MAEAGRPTKYRDHFPEQVKKLCRLGATDKEIADFFDVEESTINNWKIEFPQFMESIKAGKVQADSEVADRLYQRAMGFEHDSEEIKVISMGEGQGSSIERVPIRKIYPPDPTSAIFWLKNRRPKEWRDKQEIDHTTLGEKIQFGGVEIVQPAPTISVAELSDILKRNRDSEIPPQPEP